LSEGGDGASVFTWEEGEDAEELVGVEDDGAGGDAAVVAGDGVDDAGGGGDGVDDVGVGGMSSFDGGADGVAGGGEVSLAGFFSIFLEDFI